MCTYRSRSFRTGGLSSSTTPTTTLTGIFFPEIPRIDQKYLMHLVYHHLRPTQYLYIHITLIYLVIFGLLSSKRITGY